MIVALPAKLLVRLEVTGEEEDLGYDIIAY